MKEYINEHIFRDIPTGKIGWQSPSNIALVKYWGKKQGQIPANASVSFTLKNSYSRSELNFEPSADGLKVRLLLDGVENDKFSNRTLKYFQSISKYFPFLNQLSFTINSSNSFPHSAGIASSASGMSALALSVCSLEKEFFQADMSDEDFYKKASFMARLGSGSACRSVYGGIVSWGNWKSGTDLYGTQIPITANEIFKSYHDSILIVDSAEKKVSSSIGHNLMHTNHFASARFAQAKKNFENLIEVFKNGDLDEFIKIIELEALSLHAMMMTSEPSFILMKDKTLSIIDEIRNFREETKTPVCFTLDAGPNVHLLFPNTAKNVTLKFIEEKLKPLTKLIIHDEIGDGPVKIV